MHRIGDTILEWRRPWPAETGAGHSGLALRAGSLVIFRGATAPAKHALIRLLGLFEAPEAGELFFEGESTRAWSEARRAEVRAQRFGLVLTAPFLLPALSVAENIAMPMFKLSDVTPEEAATRAESLLEFTGLSAHARTPAGELLPEEQQAAAIARALANRPALLLVEEIDTTLSGDALRRVIRLLRNAAEKQSVAVAATATAAFPAEWVEEVRELGPEFWCAETAGPPAGLT